MNISTKNVSVFIGKKKIIEDISINIDSGEFVGIVGANGSGKSTFLKAIYRVLKPNSGSIKIGDKDINIISSKEIAKDMAVLTQEHGMQFEFSVKEVVLLGRYPHKKNFEKDNKDDYKLVYECLEKVGMLDFKDRSYSNLSGGEKQRVLLARALAQQPKVLVLDEPTNHLDIKYQIQIMEIVKRLGITVFSAIHDMNIACKYCDNIYALKNGQVTHYGKPESIFTEKFFEEIFEVEVDIQVHKKTNRLNIVYL